MKIVKNPGRFHLKPYCCAETIGISGRLAGTNWQWLWWMFCF